MKKNNAASVHEVAMSNNVADRTCTNGDSIQPLKITKSVGSIENFWGSYVVVRRVLFDYCMEVMWNAAFYDTISEYSSAWRKRKLWSGYPVFRKPAQCGNGIMVVEKLRDGDVSYYHNSGFVLLMF